MYQQIFKFIILPLVLGCFALLPTAQAQLPSPAPDGGYPGDNTAEGDGALSSLTIGIEQGEGLFNTAIGVNALNKNTTGDSNTAIGAFALENNTTAGGITAIGVDALLVNTTGGNNTAIGFNALDENTTGSSNTATGFAALATNNGKDNTANGAFALLNNTTGNYNAANGVSALRSNTTGSSNTAVGVNSLSRNTTGSSNVALGTGAGSSLTTGHGNVCIGSDVVVGVAGESNTTRIRNIFSSVASGRAVFVNSDNKIGTLVSSRRYKEDVEPMDNASETLFALKPVTFRYKKDIEPSGCIMFGLVAEDVEKVDPDLVTRNDKGEAETVRYEAVNAMLLNEFLKEHKAFVEAQHKVEKLETTVATLVATVKEQAAQIQKVSAQLEVSRPAPQTVLNQ